MAFNLDRDDRAKLDSFLGTVLDLKESGRSDRAKTVGILSHVIACATSDSMAEFHNFIRLTETQLLEPR